VRTASLAILVTAITILVSPIPVFARTDPVKRWLDGPVHYLITDDEIKEFKAAKTDPDRAAFVERFWRRRDPTPGTLVNEYRQMFWKRVAETNEKFLDSASPGWQTDRGKIYILYGPPDEIKEDPNARVGTDESQGAGLIRWVYLKPGGRRDVDPVVYVPFVRDTSGAYRVSYDPHLASPFFDWAKVDDARTAGLGRFLTEVTTSRDPLGVMLDLGKMQEVPSQEAMLLDSVETVETFAYRPLPLSIDRFAPQGAGMLAVVTVSIPAGDPADPVPALLARFSRKGAEPKILGEGSFRVEGEGAARVGQGRVALDGMPWDVTVLAVAPDSGISRIYKGRIDPLPASGLRLSDVVLARAMEPLPFATQQSYDAPYIVGGFRVTPRASTEVRAGEPLQLFYEIYGGTAPYRIAYQLEGREDDGRFRALGPPQEREADAFGQGFALPTSATWPAGAYRVVIRVSDAAEGAVERTIGWTLVAPGAPPPPDVPAPVPVEP